MRQAFADTETVLVEPTSRALLIGAIGRTTTLVVEFLPAEPAVAVQPSRWLIGVLERAERWPGRPASRSDFWLVGVPALDPPNRF